MRTAVAFIMILVAYPSFSGDAISFSARTQEAVDQSTDHWIAKETAAQWDAQKTAVIICDMWDKHWCEGANQRVAKMLDQINALTASLRSQGVLIIHAPSGTMEHYQNATQRKRAMDAPHAKPPVEIQGWCHLEPDYEIALPIDDSDGGCDCDPVCKQYSAWKSQHPGIEINEADAISDKGDEIYSLIAERGIDNILMLGVHTNMCVLGRPFGIRMMNKLGKNIALVRDLTDAMYNSRMAPYVPHDQGTQLVIKHIETYWAPTVTSSDLLD